MATIDKVMFVQQLLNKNRFRDKHMTKDEKCAIDIFIEKLDDPKKYKAHWITKEGDKYEYLMDKMPKTEDYEKGFKIDIDLGAFFAEYIIKVWGDDCYAFLSNLSLDGNVFLHKNLTPLIITIMNMTHKHKALVFKLHKIKVVEKIAIDKIRRNKIFNLGLGLKLNMRDCGMELEVC
jgi:hypothetical protein